MVTATKPPAHRVPISALRPGPHWASFEQLRINGVEGLLNALLEDQVGTLDVKNRQFALLHMRTFQRLLGQAHDAERTAHSFHALLQAIELLRENPASTTAIEHVCVLADLFAPITASGHLARPELTFDEDERIDVPAGDLDFELDPIKVERPSWKLG